MQETQKTNTSKKQTIRICRSYKACEKRGGKYVWERICNELGIDPEQKQHELGELFIEQSQCQGHCEKAPNMQIIQAPPKDLIQLHNINPIEGAKILQKIQSGT